MRTISFVKDFLKEWTCYLPITKILIDEIVKNFKVDKLHQLKANFCLDNDAQHEVDLSLYKKCGFVSCAGDYMRVVCEMKQSL